MQDFAHPAALRCIRVGMFVQPARGTKRPVNHYHRRSSFGEGAFYPENQHLAVA
jgi:hypothetical protein